MSSIVDFKTLECTQNGKTFYVSILDNEVLKSVCFVSRRDEDSEKGFQRTLNESRAKDISRYLDESRGVIPSALIISAQDNANFDYNKIKSEISFTTNANSFMVLDGQHRLYGLLKSTNNYAIPVIIFNKLDTIQEITLFIDINTTQKGVPATLLLDIKNLSGLETKKEDKQRILFDRLNKESVMAGLLLPSKSRVGKISRIAFNQATSEVFETGFFKDKDSETVYKGIKNYLEASERILKKSKSEKAKLTNSTFFRSLFSIFHDVVDKTLKVHSDLKTESFVNILEPISKLNFDSYTGTSNASFSKVVSDMRKELNEYERRYNNINSKDIF